ncbi:MAG TPA: prephenate dehydrogenase dimerization domain-containing protein, partial [Spirochaetota bacterium]
SPKNLAMDAFRGKGFRDMTRLAEGAPNVWEEICSMNASQIADALGRVIEELGEIRNALNADPVDESAVRKYLERAADVKKEIRNA